MREVTNMKLINFLGVIAIALFFLSAALLVFNNFISVGCFLYWWAHTNNIAQSAWDAFALWISTLVISGVVCLASWITIARLDVATSKYAKRK